jgi:hypothetical protein
MSHISEGISIDAVIQKSIDNIKNSSLYNLIVEESKKHNANKFLVISFCVVENIQRPKWFRKIENILPFRKTTGIMQIKNNKNLSDEESIRYAVKHYFGGSLNKEIDESELKNLVAKYTGAPNEQYLLVLEQTIMNVDLDFYYKIVYPQGLG